jgi:septum site-determining protein MinC
MTELRGIQDGFSITLKGENWPEKLNDLASKLETPGTGPNRQPQRVWLDAGDCPPSTFELEQLAWMLEMHGLQLEWWMEDVKTGRGAARSEGTNFPPAEKRQTPPHGTRPENQGPDEVRQEDQNLWSEAALVSRTVRSGQLVRYPGSVVVLGDVNPGAAVVADGNVIVWGRMRGAAHAGAAGDDKAVVGALELAPEQLRIAGHAARASELKREPAPYAEIARARRGRILFEAWDDAMG